MSDTFHIVAGERLPKLRRTLYDANGDPVNLTGATVAFRMRRRDAHNAPLVSGSASIIGTATDGVVEYAWAAGDTAAEGTYNARFVVTVSGLEMSVPNGSFVTVVVGPAV